MRRLCEVASIQPALLYQRIELLHHRLSLAAQRYERAYLARGTSRPRLRLAVDRQDHPLSWGSAIDRQAFVLKSIASVENESGYVLAQHVNYDPDENAMACELEARALGDPLIEPGFRRFARLWLPYEAGVGEQGPRDTAIGQGQSKAPDASALGLAGRGAFVHETYTMLAHFLALRPWVAASARVQFSLDRDRGVERACLLTFPERVRDGTLDAFFVRISKGLTVAKARLEMARAESVLAKRRDLAPDKSDGELVRELLAERYALARRTHDDPQNRWVAHPYPSVQEPNREVLCVTDDGRRTEARIVSGMARATLRGLDRYFMQVRRRISVLERPIRTSSTQFRAWHGYNAYSPRVVTQLLEIFRVVYNFHLKGKDGKTPAQRFEICDAALSLSELIRGTESTRPLRARSKA